jgi:signal transduction histidine kinase
LRLRQVILNLVSNALKYSEIGTPLEISADSANGMTTLRIRDYGRGVPAGDQERLFERFVRLERDMNSPVRGVGLGLAISKQLVEAMGGRMWVESDGEEGKGSVFVFSLRRDPSVRALVP